MPYGDADVFIDVKEEEFGSSLEPNCTPSSLEWMEDFKGRLEGGGVLALDPVLLGLSDDALIGRLCEVLREKVSEERLEVVMASNLHPIRLDIEEVVKRLGDVKLKPWNGSITPNIVLAALLPHPLFGFCGAPHVAIFGMRSCGDLLEDSRVKLSKPGKLDEWLIDFSLPEVVDSTLYTINIAPYEGETVVKEAGDPMKAFHEGVKLYRSSFKIEGEYPMLVASVGGSPFDSKFLGMVQSLMSMSRIVADGGEMILLSECGSSVYEPRLVRELVGLTSERGGRPMIETIRRNVSEVTDRISVRLVSTLPHSYVRKLGFKASDTASSAFQLARRRIREGKSFFVSWGYHASPG